MTLILGAVNSRYGLIFADCRISDKGKTLEEHHAKIAQLELANTRLLYAYTGLAYTLDNQFRTDVWIADTINTCLQPDMTAQQALAIIRDEATKRFQSLASSVYRKLNILFVGFENGSPLLAMLSNFENIRGS